MDNIGEVLFLAKCMELDLVASRPYAPCKYDFIVDNSNNEAIASVQGNISLAVEIYQECEGE